MRKPIKVTLATVLLLLLAGSLVLNVLLYQDRDNVVRLFSEQQFGALSPDIRKILIKDLESGDTNRIAPWISYFRHTIDLESNLNGQPGDTKTLFALYNKYERPGRSNYFGDLLNALSARQQTAGLAKDELVGFLGQPDEAAFSPRSEVLRYRFWGYGRPSIALIEITNGAVSQIAFNVAGDPPNIP